MKLTRDQYILLAAAELSKKDNKITIEDLTVKSWEINKQDFGLIGYKSKYPNSNAIYVLLMNKKGAIRKNGWLEKVGEKIYTLTSVGIKSAQELQSQITESKKIIGGSNPDDDGRIEENKLKIFLSSRTVQDILNGEKEYIFLNACVFWGIPELPNARQLDIGLANTDLYIKKLHDKIKKSGKHYSGPKNFQYSLKNIELLKSMHEDFKSKFSDKIERIKKLTDERKHK